MLSMNNVDNVYFKCLDVISIHDDGKKRWW